MKLCECGCKKEVSKEGNKFIQGHNVKVNNPMKRPEVAKKNGDSHRGKTKENDESVRKRAEKQKGNEKVKEHLARMRKQIKNPSKEELKLRLIIKEAALELFGENVIVEHTYSILNYDVDDALPEYKIAVEYDGWYHFNIPGRKEYDTKRQQEIEQEGWKFIRYTMFDKFPTKEQVKEDIETVRNFINS